MGDSLPPLPKVKPSHKAATSAKEAVKALQKQADSIDVGKDAGEAAGTTKKPKAAEAKTYTSGSSHKEEAGALLDENGASKHVVHEEAKEEASELLREAHDDRKENKAIEKDSEDDMDDMDDMDGIDDIVPETDKLVA